MTEPPVFTYLLELLSRGVFTSAALSTDKGNWEARDYLHDDDIDQAIAQSMQEREAAYIALKLDASEISFAVATNISHENGVRPFDLQQEGQIIALTIWRGRSDCKVETMPVRFDGEGWIETQPIQTVACLVSQLPPDIPGMILIKELEDSA